MIQENMEPRNHSPQEVHGNINNTYWSD